MPPPSNLRLIPTVTRGWPALGGLDSQHWPNVDVRGIPVPMRFEVDVAVFEDGTEEAARIDTIRAFYQVVHSEVPRLQILAADVMSVPDALDLLRSELGLRPLLETALAVLAPEEAKWQSLLDGARYPEIVAHVDDVRRRVSDLPLTNRSDPVPLAKIQEAADVYNRAVKSGGWPVAAVRKHFDVSRTTAHRYVQKAKEQGLIREHNVDTQGGRG